MRILLASFALTAALGAALPACAAPAEPAPAPAETEAHSPSRLAALVSRYRSGSMGKAEKARAAQVFAKAAAAGDPRAQWQLGVMIDKGETAGSLQDAVELFRRAAGQKNADAMASLAVMYARGRGVEQDYAAAMRYYQAAARFGNAHALQGLGVLYANGQGVGQDMHEALAYWLVAAAAGDASALTLLDRYLPTDTRETAAIYERANTIADAYGILPRAQVQASSHSSSSK